jgi:hypothetical protein
VVEVTGSTPLRWHTFTALSGMPTRRSYGSSGRIAARDPDLIFIAAAPEFAPIRSDPRIASLALKVGVMR